MSAALYHYFAEPEPVTFSCSGPRPAPSRETLPAEVQRVVKAVGRLPGATAASVGTLIQTSDGHAADLLLQASRKGLVSRSRRGTAYVYTLPPSR